MVGFVQLLGLCRQDNKGGKIANYNIHSSFNIRKYSRIFHIFNIHSAH